MKLLLGRGAILGKHLARGSQPFFSNPLLL